MTALQDNGSTFRAQRSLRIAYVTPFYAPILNGVALAVHRRAKWLLSRGHHVHLLHPNIDGQFPDEVRTRPLPGLPELAANSGFSSWAYPCRPHPLSKSNPVPRSFRHWEISDRIDAFRPDLILLEDIPYLVGLSSPLGGGYRKWIASEYARKARIPTIGLVETDWLEYGKLYFGPLMSLMRPLLVPFIRRMTAAYDLHLHCSEESLRKSQVLGAVHSESLPFHGIVCDDYRPAPDRPVPIPNDDRPLLLCVARFCREKNVLLLFKAFKQIRDAIPNAHLVLIGGGPQEAVVRRKARFFGDSVTLPGEVFGDHLKAWYARADLYVNPSVTETFCTTNLEALASGTPVVAAVGGGHIEQVIDEHNGLLARPNDAVDFARNAIRFFKDEELRTRLRSHARESVRPFDWSACCERLEAAMYQLQDRCGRVS